MNTRCLVPKCKAKPTARGVCSRHYMQAKRAVRRGKATWAKLEREGKVRPLREPSYFER